MKITFLLLAHQQPRIVKRLIDALLWAGHTAVLHYDRKASDADFDFLREAFAGNPNVRFARRVRVGWGEWSIVAATLNCIEEIEAAGWAPDYVYYASGTDYPIRPASELAAFLERNKGREFIEGVPADRVKWVKGGPQRERYQYRFYFNWRTRSRLSRHILNFQKLFGLKRPFVLGLEPFIGSQWWVLTWGTIQEIMKLARRPEVIRFFRTTLIPDELFFQTLVYNTVDKANIVARPLTLYQFTDYWVPVVFYADHTDYLLRQPFFMARKLSANNPALHDTLDACWRGEIQPAAVDDAAIGTVTPEYEAWRLARRLKEPGLPIVGHEANGWSGGLSWFNKPHFVIHGSSALELYIAQSLLSANTDLVCHGQLLHARRIEFAGGLESYAGYAVDALPVRNLSAPNFLADVMRAEKERLPGFLLRFGDGWHIPEVLFDHPTSRVLLIHGDRLLGFLDYMANSMMTDSIDLSTLRTFSPAFIALKFEQYQGWIANYTKLISRHLVNSKPKGEPLGFSWIGERTFDLTAGNRPRTAKAAELTESRWVAATLDLWRDWLIETERTLNVKLARPADDPIWSQLEDQLKLAATARNVLSELLAKGELTRVTTLEGLDELVEDTVDMREEALAQALQLAKQTPTPA